MHDISFLSQKQKKLEEQEQQKLKSKKFGQIEFYTPQEKIIAKQTKLLTQTKALIGILKKFFNKWKKPSFAKKTKKDIEIEKKEIETKEVKMPKTDISEIAGLTRMDQKPNSQASVNQATNKPAKVESEIPLTQPEVGEDFSAIDVNLMPWQDPRFKRNKKIRLVAIISSLLIIIAWGLSLRIKNISQQSKILELESSISLIDEQLSNIDLELLSQGSVIAIRQNKFIELYTQLPEWSKFFIWLESRTEPNVYFKDLKVESFKKVVLDAVALDYSAAARQWLAFKTATSWVETVKINEFTLIKSEALEEPKVEFSIELSLEKTALVNEKIQEINNK